MGTIETVLTVLNIGVMKYRPQTWKKSALQGVGDKTDKDSVRQYAVSLYPHLYGELSRKKDHNRAESLMLLHFGESCEGISVSARNESL